MNVYQSTYYEMFNALTNAIELLETILNQHQLGIDTAIVLRNEIEMLKRVQQNTESYIIDEVKDAKDDAETEALGNFARN